MLSLQLQKLVVASCIAACLWAATTSTAHALAETDALGPDKALHYSVSVGLTLGASLVFDGIGFDEPTALPLSIGFALGMGIGKELFDAVRGGGFSAADLTWDVLGIATGLFLRVLLRELFFATPGPTAAITSSS
jgi:putative lipoprotein